MNRIASAFAASLLAGTLVGAPRPVHAQEMSPSASEWRGYCKAYLEAVDRDAQGNDLDITY